MVEPFAHTCCPYVGLEKNPSVTLEEPTTDHRCYAQQIPFTPDAVRQQSFCLGATYLNCAFYTDQARQQIPLYYTMTTPVSQPAPPPPRPKDQRERRSYRLAVLLMSGLGALLLFLLLPIFATQLKVRPWNVLPLPPAPASTATTAPPPTRQPSITPSPLVIAALLSPTPTPTPTTTATRAQPTSRPSQRAAATTPSRTSADNAQPLLLTPKAGQAGWWKEKDQQRNHIDDSYLYTGVYAGSSFIAAISFDLSKVPRGASIQQAQLRLTGLRQDLLQPAAVGTWWVQLLPESSMPTIRTADYPTMLTAPSTITLLPPLKRTALAAGKVNQWDLDASARHWLEEQLLAGATSVTFRLQSAVEQGEALFAWDRGLGSETAGNGPQLALALGPPPPTPPPLPTAPHIVATFTPVPKDVLAVVALAQTATQVATTIGTYTPIPFTIVTPTPFPANLATVQVAALIQGLPPVVLHTPTPASADMATRDADYATAVALTTGTFTPVPTVYVTPLVVAPSPPPENIATEAARVVAATAVASSGGPTATALPYNAVIGIYVYATATPGNQATAAADAVIADAQAKVNGTPTALPWNAIIITRVPTPRPTLPPTVTPLPPLQPASELTPTPSPTAVVAAPATLPDYIRNKILFKSNRGGLEEIYALDPTSGALYRVNESWLYTLAESRQALAPDGKHKVIVKRAADHTLQLHILSIEYQKTQQLTALTGADIGRTAINYDPAWSPNGDTIVFVSTNSGNDELYSVTVDGRVVTKLTNNQYEWDKHPSWSPDGRQIVFYSNRATGRRQLWLMNADGSDQRNFSQNSYEDWDPVWVP